MKGFSESGLTIGYPFIFDEGVEFWINLRIDKTSPQISPEVTSGAIL
jgi:hypothetical protein